jgi:2-amino-4-hydroxy-6-hydroxymethyldihydropteridine diphosphokinase
MNETRRNPMEIGLSLGSNIGNRLDNLKEARRRILATSGMKRVAQSSVYETEPVGVKLEYRRLEFLNAVLIVDSPCSAPVCYNQLRKIEDDMGRHRSPDRYSPRSIDIDLIYIDNLHLENGGLLIPHPHWAERRFVVQPLADIRPDLILPGADKTVAQILAALTEKADVTLLTQTW